MIPAKGTEDEEGEESKSGIFAVRSINIEESEESKVIMKAHWFVSGIRSSICENPREPPFVCGGIGQMSE